MSVEYRLDIYNPFGVMQSRLVGSAAGDRTGGFLDLAYVKRVNEEGLLTFVLDGTHELVSALQNRSIIEVWRRNIEQGIDWYNDFTALFLDQERSYIDHALFKASCPGPLWLLRTRHILWYADTANRSRFINVPAETIMKTLVDYNAGPNATQANGRLRTPNSLNITVEADGGHGDRKDWFCAWDSLLQSLQALVKAGAGGDFDLVRTAGANWQFRWYMGQRGTDRGSSILFALEYGNMRNPVYRRLRMKEATVALAGGQGEGSSRTTVVRTGADYAADNDIEIFVQASHSSTTDGLGAEGDAALKQRQAEHEFSFDVIQDGPYLYGRDYFLGDLVKARYDAIEVTRKVVGVQISFNRDGREEVKVEMGAV